MIHVWLTRYDPLTMIHMKSERAGGQWALETVPAFGDAHFHALSWWGDRLLDGWGHGAAVPVALPAAPGGCVLHELLPRRPVHRVSPTSPPSQTFHTEKDTDTQRKSMHVSSCCSAPQSPPLIREMTVQCSRPFICMKMLRYASLKARSPAVPVPPLLIGHGTSQPDQCYTYIYI